MTEAVEELIGAWEAAVRYRRALARDGGPVRPHLEDMDTYGVIVEMADDDYLVGTPAEVMDRIIREGRRLPLRYPLYDPAQEIYDAALLLLERMGVLNQRYIEENS